MRRLTAIALAIGIALFTACGRQPAQTETTQAAASQRAADIAQTVLTETEQTVSETQTETQTVTATTTQPPVTTTQPPVTMTPHTSLTLPDPQPPEVGSAAFTARRVRVNREYDQKFETTAVAVESRAQLRDAVAAVRNVLPDDIAAYTDAWFTTHRLIVITLQESSGSVRHDVRSVAYTTDGVQVTVKRSVPDVQTCDVAHWLLFIELDDTRLRGGDPVAVTVQ